MRFAEVVHRFLRIRSFALTLGGFLSYPGLRGFLKGHHDRSSQDSKPASRPFRIAHFGGPDRTIRTGDNPLNSRPDSEHPSSGCGLLSMQSPVRVQSGDHNTILTRAWFVRRLRSVPKSIAHQQFDRNWGKGSYLGERRVQADLRSLVATCSSIRKTVNKYIAHNDRRKSIRVATHRDINNATDEVYRLVSRYNALLFNAAWGEPVPLPWVHVFDSRWSSPLGSPHRAG